MYRNYRPRKTTRTPPSKASEWFGNLIVGIMGFCGVASFGWFILCILYVLITKGIPKAYVAVAEWGSDVITIISEHNWKYTDVLLYVGIAIILAFRYTNALVAIGWKDAPYESNKKEGV